MFIIVGVIVLILINFVTEYCAAVIYMMFDMCNCPQFIQILIVYTDPQAQCKPDKIGQVI